MKKDCYAISKDCRRLGYKDHRGISRLMALPAEASAHFHLDEHCPLLERYRDKAIIGIGIYFGPDVRIGNQNPCPYCREDDPRPLPPLEQNTQVKAWIQAFKDQDVEIDPSIAGGFANSAFWKQCDDGEEWMKWAMQAELQKGKQAKVRKPEPPTERV